MYFTIKNSATQDIRHENTMIPTVSIRDLPWQKKKKFHIVIFFFSLSLKEAYIYIDDLTAGYFVILDLDACLEAHINTTELNKSMKASIMVEKIDKEPDLMAATNCNPNSNTLAITEP